jgi:hypothetical protein
MKQELNEVQKMNYDAFFANVENLMLSPSALKLMLESPKTYFKHYVLGEKDVKTGKHFDEGSLVHCMVLEPDELKEKFVNMGISVPTDSTRLCIEHLLSLGRDASELEEYHEEIIAYLKDVNLHQSLVDDKKAPWKTGDEKRLEKIITENSIEYFRIMVEGRDKTIVDVASWDKCYAKAEAILSCPEAVHLLKHSNETDEVRYELELSDRPDELQYGVKGIMDVIKVDREAKTIYISDVKTHGGKLKDFAAAVEKYDYWLQPVVYKILAKSLLRGKAFDYNIVFHFITVDQNNNVYCFPISDESMNKWNDQLVEIINHKFTYHLTTQDFTLPYEFANNLISL